MLKLSDKDILEGVRSGDNRVISYLIRIYFPRIKKYILRNKGNNNDAEDVFQEALVIIFDKLRQGGLQINKEFGSFLYGVVRVIWTKELNNRGWSYQLDGQKSYDWEDQGLMVQFELRERQKMYDEYFNKLGDECKKLLQLFFNGIKIKEITQEMGFSTEQHTKNKKYICKKHLIENIRANPKFKEIKNERLDNVSEIPRW
jgi:RNA polymerase sigma factor (sigma-70 family)